jgi:hypothetical protein
VSEISLSCTFAGVWFYSSLFLAVFSFVFVYVHLANDHGNNVSYFPFMSIKKIVPYFCVLREGYYAIIWLIVRICVCIEDWKLIYSELFILKRKSMENWGDSWHKLYSMHFPVKRTWFGHVRCCHHLASVVRCPSVNFSYFNLLLWNNWTKWNQTWQKASI